MPTARSRQFWRRFEKNYEKQHDLFYTCSLIEDVCDDDYDHVVDRLVEVYTSWIDAVLCNYNTDVYYQLREYIYECCKEGQICA